LLLRQCRARRRCESSSASRGFLLLHRWREGDSNIRSVWICTRNDAIGNLAVMAAALGVFGSGTGWPDYLVAAIMSGLALWGAGQIMRHAFGELRVRRPQAVGSL
jgi:Co/Zn/Cd efflux system component